MKKYVSLDTSLCICFEGFIQYFMDVISSNIQKMRVLFSKSLNNCI